METHTITADITAADTTTDITAADTIAADTPPPPVPTTTYRTKTEAGLWMLFGIVGSYGSAALAIPLTTPTVESSTDDFAGLLYLLTVPLGFVVGTIMACVIASRIERESRSKGDLFTRTELTFFGVLLPILLVFAAGFLASALN